MFQNLATTVANVPMAPIFVVAHMILVSLSMRGIPGTAEFALKHPLPSWFVCVTGCFSGKVIQNFLLGKPMIEIYLNVWNLSLATFVWYLVFFSPMDFTTTVCNNKYIKALLKLLKELHRIRGIKDGVAVASAAYSGNPVAAVLLGTIRGSGAAWLLRPLYQFICGDLKAENEFYKPGFASKYSFMSACMMVVNDAFSLGIDASVLVFVLFVVGATGQMLMFFKVIDDPCVRLENMGCYVTMELPNQLLSKKNEKPKDE